MRKVKLYNKYIKLKNDKDLAIYVGFKFNRFLVINTFFNPFLFPDFHADVLKISAVYRVSIINTYDDGTGYVIFTIDPKVEKCLILSKVEKLFAIHFFNDVQNGEK